MRMKRNIQNIQDIIDQIGLGGTQIILAFSVCLAALCCSSQLSSLVFVLNGLEDKIPVTTAEKGVLSAVSSLGALTAHIIAGNIADNYGRRNISLLMFLMSITLSMLQGFVSSVVQLAVVRLLLGISIGALETSGRPLVAELAPSKYRSSLLSVCHLGFELGFSLSVLFAWLFLNSYGIQGYLIAINFPNVIAALLFLFFVVEAPQFYMLKRNQIKLSDEDISEMCFKRKIIDEEVEEKLSICQQIQCVLQTTLCIFEKPYKWYACAFLATSLSVTTGIGGIINWLPLLFKDLNEIFVNQYLQVLLIDFFVFPALALSVPLLEVFGRRPVGFFCCMVSGFAFLVFFFVPKTGFVPIVTLMLQRGLVSAVANCTQVVAMETFPAQMRATAIGLILSSFKIGAGISSFLFPFLVCQWVYLPILFAAAFLFQASFFITFWPQTNKYGRVLKSSTYSYSQTQNIILNHNDVQQPLITI